MGKTRKVTKAANLTLYLGWYAYNAETGKIVRAVDNWDGKNIRIVGDPELRSFEINGDTLTLEWWSGFRLHFKRDLKAVVDETLNGLRLEQATRIRTAAKYLRDIAEMDSQIDALTQVAIREMR